MFALLHSFVMLSANGASCRDSSCTVENWKNWSSSNNSWQANAGDPGDNWTGSKNPFGPIIPLGAHGLGGSAPPVGGWESGECNTNGQAQCGSGPAPMVAPGHGWGVKPP
mmetsp:Transcript_8564/g.20240  ORF Transcript_8564/g.20240 Transcript_8564/m.20240 type:complete len:110 (+) Transcript_8564:50-379(+)